MRILHVNKFLFRKGGADAYMLDVADLQRQAGDEVEFFGMSHPNNRSERYEELFPSQVELEQRSGSIVSQARISARMLWSRSAARGMDAVVRDFQPDVAHLHTIYHQLSPSILRPLAAHRVPIVITLHDYKLVCPTYQMLDRGEICEACIGHRFHNAALRRCKDGSLLSSALLASELALHTATRAYGPIDVFICPSRFMLDKMTEGGVYPDRLRHLPHFSVPGSESSDGPRAGVIVAGRLSPEKGIDTLVRAMGMLDAPDVLEIAGDGPERELLEQLANDVAPGRVRFIGRLDRDALMQRIARASVMAVPSVWYENQPMTVLEAFGCGTPVVASSIGGIPELISDGVDGLLVPHGDPGALAEALDNVLQNPEMARGMGQAGLAKVRADFDPAVHLRGLARVYEEAARRVAGGNDVNR